MREFKGIRADLQNTFVCFKENTTYLFIFSQVDCICKGRHVEASEAKTFYLFIFKRTQAVFSIVSLSNQSLVCCRSLPVALVFPRLV